MTSSPHQTSKFDVIVIGGGAAGLFCAIGAGKRRRHTLVLEHSDRIGKKIAISGGGRCNFTNLNTNPDAFISANPHFCKSALARYTPRDLLALVESHRIPYHEKKLGQLFCDGSSQQIINMLLEECADAGVEIRCGLEVRSIRQNSCFAIETTTATFTSDSLVIATGGLSIPTLGASDFGYRIARQFGLEIEYAKPGLVPFTLSTGLREQLSKLSGISLDATVGLGDHTFHENILLTHRGLSGPAILQASSYWRAGQAISINILPGIDVLAWLTENRNSEIELANLLSRHLPKRFAQAWCEIYAQSKRMKQFGPGELASIAQKLTNMEIIPSGTEGFKKAEVTVGGVSTTELSSQSMEAKRVRGLYFIGELVDVTGHLGGYNFQWAWASGHAAGQYV